MDVSMDGLVAVHEHPGSTIQMGNDAEGLAEEPKCCLLFAMDALTDRLVVAH